MNFKELIDHYKNLNAHYSYQNERTALLDNINSEFSQETIDKIALWKINRYSDIPINCLKLINSIKSDDRTLDEEKTREIFRILLNPKNKGFQIAMISTILRFRNPHIYQIIDQRVYRLLYPDTTLGEVIKIKKTDDEKVTLYLEYLGQLRGVCEKYNIAFSDSDRVLYLVDKEINKGRNLD